MKNLTELSNEIHAENVQAGWWDDWPVKTDRHETAIMLVISEIAEAMEGHRKNLMDDHLPQFKMFDVELADALIRLLDLAGAYEIDLAGYDFITWVDRKIESYKSLTIPEQLFKLTSYCHAEIRISALNSIVHLMVIAQINNVDIFTVMQAKREYNAKRADHKRENRSTQHGKKY